MEKSCRYVNLGDRTDQGEGPRVEDRVFSVCLRRARVAGTGKTQGRHELEVGLLPIVGRDQTHSCPDSRQ